MKKRRKQTALTLVEIMITMLILMITLGGILGFRYHSVLNAERAEDQLLAARAAVAISEAWRGQRGAADFDPVQQSFASDFQIQAFPFWYIDSPPYPMSVHLGTYRIDIEGRIFRADLSYQNDVGATNARQLNVVLTWWDSRRNSQEFRLSTLTRTNS
jgi:hypothetical protein